MILQYTQQLINLKFLGDLGSKEMTAAMGLALVLQALGPLSMALGMNGAMEPVVSQAFGAGNLDACSVQFNKNRFAVTVLMIPMSVVLLFTEQILVAANQDKKTSEYAGILVRHYIPGIYIKMLMDGYKRYLNCFQRSSIPFWIYVVGNMIQVPVSYLLIIEADWGMAGVAWSMAFVDLFMLLSMSAVAHCLSDLKGAFRWPDRRIFNDFKGYLKLGVPMWLIILSNFGSSQVMSFFVGMIGVTELAAHTIFSMLKNLIYHIPLGLQTTSCIFIGKQIGLLDIVGSKQYLRNIYQLTAVLAVLVCLLYFLLKTPLVNTFTQNEEVRSVYRSIFVISVFCIFADFGRGIQVGVVRALERQGLAFKFNFSISWFIMIPLCYILPFTAELGLPGVYVAFLIGQALLQMCLQVIIQRADWEALVEKSKERIKNIQNHPDNKSKDDEPDERKGEE